MYIMTVITNKLIILYILDTSNMYIYICMFLLETMPPICICIYVYIIF